MAHRTQQLEFRLSTWGGRRSGAGRRPSPGRRAVPHRRRPPHDARCPVHVTLRARTGLPCLRGDRAFGAVRGALSAASAKGFRVLHFSVQGDHVHLLVESDAKAGVRPGVQGLAIRVAKAVNRALGRRGAVWGGRYHARALSTPREVRHALVYVLQNWRKHVPGARGLDPRSSARWFTGWRTQTVAAPSPSPVAVARTWLVRTGWRRHGLIGAEDCPRGTRKSVRRQR